MGGSIAGQTSSLTFSAASGVQGGTSPLNLTLTSPAGSSPVALQLTLTYDPSSVIAVNATMGPSAIAAAKTMQCDGRPGLYTCLIAGLNVNAIPDGVVGVVNVTLSPSASSFVSVGISNVMGASSTAVPLVLSGTAGAISVSTLVGTPPPTGSTPPPPSSTGTAPPPGATGTPAAGGSISSGGALSLNALLCNPSVLSFGNTATCSVSLNQPAPAGGASIALFTSSTALTGPTAVTVPAGSTQTNFSITAAANASDSFALLTALFNATSQRLRVSLTGAANTAPVIAVPTITGIPAGVLDAAGYTPNVSQGGVFVVKGSSLCPDGVVQAAGYPLTTTLNGVSISLTPAAGGVSVTPYMISTYSRGGTSQVAALLPSTVAPGI